MHTLRHIADIEAELGLHDEASRNYARVIDTYRKSSSTHPMDLANALRGRAILSEILHETDQARADWNEAQDIYAAHHIDEGVEECREHLRGLIGKS